MSSNSNDIFISTNAHDSFDGGHGKDTVRFAGNAAGYLIDTYEDGSMRVVDIDASDGDTGTDWLESIEVLRFADGAYSVANTGPVRVNSDTPPWAGSKYQSAVTGLSGGGYVVTWASDDQDGSGVGVYAQQFDAAGNPVGAEVQVNTYTNSTQQSPKITSLSDGGYAITWTSAFQDGSYDGTYVQRFAASGNKVGAEVQANTYPWDHQNECSIAGLNNGGYVVVWRSYAQETTSHSGIYFQLFDASGAKVGGEIHANTYTLSWQDAPDVATLANGSFVITWESEGQDGSGAGIFAQRFDASGNKIGGELQANTHTADEQDNAAITALTGGGYVITWESYAQDGTSEGIYAQRFNTSGGKIGGETRVNTTTSGSEFSPGVTALSSGGYVVCWDAGNNISFQAFDASGNAVGGEKTLAYVGQAMSFLQPDVASLTDGGFVISWHNYHGIQSQRFDADGDYWGPTITTIKGTAGDDVITCMWGQQVLRGLAGNDILDGGLYQDTLYGGAGNDAFRISRMDTRDKIADFVVADDTIQLDNTWAFGMLTVPGTLNAANFRASTSGNAADSNDYILYETDTGKLFYDHDGTGTFSQKILFAILVGKPIITAADFEVI